MNYMVNIKEFEQFHKEHPTFIKPNTILYNDELVIIDIENMSKEELEQFCKERQEFWNKKNIS